MHRTALLLALPFLLLAACGEHGEESCPLDTPLSGEELPCDCQGELVEALPGDGSTCTCTEDGFDCEGGIGDTAAGD